MLIRGNISAGLHCGTGTGWGRAAFLPALWPKTFNPLLVEDESSEAVRYLTGGVLVRVNRLTLKAQPELASEWKVSEGGKRIRFKLREGLKYSDGTRFSAADVAYTMQQLMDPALHSSTGDAFRSGDGKLTTQVISPSVIEINFPAPVANLVNLFDTVAILSASSPQKEMAALGPFYIAEHKAGSYLLLKRNPYYWKKDADGKQLPYLDAIHLDIEQNPEIEAMRYKRGEVQLDQHGLARNFRKALSRQRRCARRRRVNRYGTAVVQPGAGRADSGV